MDLTYDAPAVSRDDPHSTESTVSYYILNSAKAGPKPPEDKRAPATWSTFALVYGQQLVLRPVEAALSICSERAWLRLTTAIDDRVQRKIAVSLPSGKLLGVLDLRYAHAIEMFQLELIGKDVLTAFRNGLVLELCDEGYPLWFFSAGDEDELGLPIEYHPHLMTAPDTVNPENEFHNRFASLASLQSFGWMEGCILDGLRGLARFGPDRTRYEAARKLHWQTYTGRFGELTYESPRSAVVTNEVYGIEGGLPFADLVLSNPQHPWLEHFSSAMQRFQRKDGAIQDDDVLSAEGCYTVAFPLAALAVAQGSIGLAVAALTQLRIRQRRLWHDDALWLRYMDNDERTFRNWARAVAWYLLGMMRTLELLRDGDHETSDLEREALRVAKWALSHQLENGLWSVYVDDHNLGVDTSGSAGIATALALGARIGVLTSLEASAAKRTLASLNQYLTPDGFLGGTSQANRGGEVLQRSDYRVLSQMAMGLKAQLIGEVFGLDQNDAEPKPTRN